MAITILSFDTPTGNVVPVFDGGNFTGAFRVGAQFAAAGDDACGVIEYRQYIKGEMVVGGVPFRKQVGIGLYLSSTDFQIRCLDSNGQPLCPDALVPNNNNNIVVFPP